MQTSQAYHNDRTHLSSSILKMLLTDFNKFYERWVLNLQETESKPQFSEGSLVHALILEPAEVEKRYAFYPGLRRTGADFEAFKAANEGKEILLMSAKLRADRAVEAYRARPEAVELIQNSLPEHNMFGEILGIKVKARADAINVEKGFIVDVKTTSYPSDVEIFKGTIGEYMYQLSAALYCKIAEQVYARPFAFYWVVISKQDFQCHVYKMGSETYRMGTSLMMKALVEYKNYEKKLDQKQETVQNSIYEVEEV